MLQASQQLNRIFETCSEDTYSPKLTELIRLAATLAGTDAARSGAGALRKASAAGATDDELHCVACLSACTSGPATMAVFTKAMKSAKRKPSAQVAADVLDKKSTHLASLAACLASHCDCAAGHIVEARRAGAKEEEIARVGCLTACAGGLNAKWRFVAALQCAGSRKQCAC